MLHATAQVKPNLTLGKSSPMVPHYSKPSYETIRDESSATLKAKVQVPGPSDTLSKQGLLTVAAFHQKKGGTSVCEFEVESTVA